MARSPKDARTGRRVDPRLVVGAVLVAGSTAGVWALVAALDTASEVYVVRDTVTPGHRLGAGDLAKRSVQLGGALDRYLTPGAMPRDGLTVTRTVQAGELLPLSAVTPGEFGLRATVVVTTRGALPSGLGPGSLVDVWSSSAVERGEPAAPEVLIASAEIAAVSNADGLIAREQVSVELLVSHDEVGLLLKALADGATIDLVAARLEERG